MRLRVFAYYYMLDAHRFNLNLLGVLSGAPPPPPPDVTCVPSGVHSEPDIVDRKLRVHFSDRVPRWARKLPRQVDSS